MCCPCCTNTLNLGCVDPCLIDFNAGVVGVGDAGIWSLRLDFGRSFILFEITLAEGDPILFAIDGLNENYTFTATITKPDGSTFTFTDADANVYDCFKFTTKINAPTEITLI